jgi:hypothetical protein
VGDTFEIGQHERALATRYALGLVLHVCCTRPIRSRSATDDELLRALRAFEINGFQRLVQDHERR